jgi:signal transduction histidine kinase
MRRLYQKIYLTILASLVLVVMAAGMMWRIGADSSPTAAGFEFARELAAAALPPASAPALVQQEALGQIAGKIDIDVALFDRMLSPIAAIGSPLPPPRSLDRSGLSYGGRGPIWSVQLPDERWLVVRARRQQRHPAIGIILFIGSIALAVGLGAYPIVRGLTRRLERLQTGVEKLGSGDLAARVRVEGRDEVARLAESFNRAAIRIEELVGAHRLLLANASHELRTPLSRIRLGLELLQQNNGPKYRTQIEQDIAELDAMIEEILLASRLDANPTVQASEDVDLLALAAEEGSRYDNCSVDGIPLNLRGDPRLLRRMIRNLIENAKRHGTPPIEVTVRRDSGLAVIEVADHGPGVREDAREQVFSPFFRLGDAGGTGLGLALVRRIARVHGGDAMVVDGARACFRVTLPLDA